VTSFRYAAITHLGLSRASNEDAAYVRVEDRCAVLAVADGMGGLPGGDIASSLAIASVERGDTRDAAPRFLARACADANAAIIDAGERDPALRGLGSTLVVAIVRDGQAFVAHVGDSRAYLLHEGTLEAVTTDHNLAAEPSRGGAGDGASRHILTRSLGRPGAVPDLGGPHAIEDGDALLLVSDGVSGVLDDRVLQEVALGATGPALARAIVAAALEAGGPDNIAVALLDTRP
jgi:serine/threonine protein phosphatase PrpC